VALNWDEIKKAERAQRGATDPAQVSALDGVPFGQPGLSLASQLQGRAARAGLPDDLLTEPAEPAEPAEADGTGDGQGDSQCDAQGDALGDRLFALVATARAADLDPELELRAAARRYAERARAWERAHPA
jgi:XTP/dITP diphosphohydrolase